MTDLERHAVYLAFIGLVLIVIAGCIVDGLARSLLRAIARRRATRRPHAVRPRSHR